MTKWLMFICIPVFFTSCFDFVEELTIKSDGSGEARYRLNLSQSKVKLASIMLMDSIRGHKVPDRTEVDDKLRSLKFILNKQPGLHGVKVKSDWENYIFELAFDFDSVAAVNKGLKSAFEKDQTIKSYFFDPFTYTDTKFQRHYKHHDFSKYSDQRTLNTDVLQEASYIGIYRFPKTVTKQTNTNYKSSKAGNAVMFKSSFLDLIDRKVSLENTVTLQ